MMKARYGRVIVKKLFMYCSKETKAEIVNKRILGNVMQLMKHKVIAGHSHSCRTGPAIGIEGGTRVSQYLAS